VRDIFDRLELRDVTQEQVALAIKGQLKVG